MLAMFQDEMLDTQAATAKALAQALDMKGR
jgi:hypothetical protein